MNSITEVAQTRGSQLRDTKILSDNFIASLEKVEQALLNLNEHITSMSKRCEEVANSRDCSEILNNVIT